MTLEAMFFGAFFGLISAVAIYHLLMYAVLRVPEFSVVRHLSRALAISNSAATAVSRLLGIGADANVLFWSTFSALAFFGYWLFRSFLSLPRCSRDWSGPFRADVRVRGRGAVRALDAGPATTSAMKALALALSS